MRAIRIYKTALYTLPAAMVLLTSCGKTAQTTTPTAKMLIGRASTSPDTTLIPSKIAVKTPTVYSPTAVLSQETATFVQVTQENPTIMPTLTRVPSLVIQKTPAAVPPAAEASPRVVPRTASPAQLKAVQQARNDLAQRVGVDPGSIELLSIRRRMKSTGVSDSSGRFVGWEIGLGVEGRRYNYYVDANGKLHRR